MPRYYETLRKHRFRFTRKAVGNAQAPLNVPRSSLCSGANCSVFRRRCYEMAECACVAEAQRIAYIEATRVFHDDPGLLA